MNGNDMKLTMTAAAALIAISGAAFADGHANQGFNMLQAALMDGLNDVGIDPSVLSDDLTLGQIATIKSILDSDENMSQKKGRIEAIIANQ